MTTELELLDQPDAPLAKRVTALTSAEGRTTIGRDAEIVVIDRETGEAHSLGHIDQPRGAFAALASSLRPCPIGDILACAEHRRAERASQLAELMRLAMPSAEELAASFARLGALFSEGMQAGTAYADTMPSNRRERRALAAGAPVEDGAIKLRPGTRRKREEAY